MAKKAKYCAHEAPLPKLQISICFFSVPAKGVYLGLPGFYLCASRDLPFGLPNKYAASQKLLRSRPRTAQATADYLRDLQGPSFATTSPATTSGLDVGLGVGGADGGAFAGPVGPKTRDLGSSGRIVALYGQSLPAIRLG